MTENAYAATTAVSNNGGNSAIAAPGAQMVAKPYVGPTAIKLQHQR